MLNEGVTKAETVNGLYTADLIHRRGFWKSIEAVEYATLERTGWCLVVAQPTNKQILCVELTILQAVALKIPAFAAILADAA